MSSSDEIQSLALDVLPLVKDGNEAALLVSITILTMKIDAVETGLSTQLQHRQMVDEQYARLVATAASSKEYTTAYNAAHFNVASGTATTTAATDNQQSNAATTAAATTAAATAAAAAAVCPLLFKNCLALRARETVMTAAMNEALDKLAACGAPLRQYG